MNQPLKYSSRRTSLEADTPSTKNPPRIRPLASGHQPPIPKSLRQRIVASRDPADGPERLALHPAGPPALVLGQDLLVHVRVEPNVVVDEKHRIPGRAVDAHVSLHGEAARRGMDVVERDLRVGAERLDVRARRRLIARVDDAELLREHGLPDEALDRVAEVVRPVPRRDDEGRAGPLSLGLRCAHGTRRHDRTVVPCART